MNGHDFFDGMSEEEILEYDEIGYAYDAHRDMYDDMEWKRINNHPNYEVSDSGLVASFRKKYPKVLSTWSNQYGHRYVQIDGEKQSVHRLVAEHFIPNPYNYPVVRHLDDDPTNNYYKNLAWGTAADNRRDCIEHGRDFVKSVYCYETGKIYRSCAEAADDLGVTRGAITICCQGKTHECKGHHLCYLDDKDNKTSNLEEWLNHSSYKPLKAINVRTGEELYFQSRKEAAKTLGIPNCGISSTITGHTPHTHGWRFEDRSK